MEMILWIAKLGDFVWKDSWKERNKKDLLNSLFIVNPDEMKILSC